jgi:LmbE family N-acetylglucosaminyl deacetylase
VSVAHGRPPTVPVPVWSAAIDGRAPAPLAADVTDLVVVAAHPDDETLAAGGFVHAVHAGGGRVTVVLATDGEAAFGAASADLGRERRAELRRALDVLGPGADALHPLGLPDGALDRHEDALAGALEPLLAGATLCLAPWTGDPHPDHAAAGRAALRAAPPGAHRFGYPVWTLPWRTPDDPEIPWDEAVLFRAGAAAREAKRRALAAFATQVGPAPDGGAPILPAEVREHFDTGSELFFRVPRTGDAPIDRFAALYASDDDPWGVRSRWYERRKRAVLLASLPRERYHHAAEPGCGLGVLTADLAARCDRVTASDPAGQAARAAADATAGSPGVTVHEVGVDDQRAIPAGVDLVVLGELLYYLMPAAVDAVADRVTASAAPGADVVLVHWRGRAPEAPQAAAAVHRRFREDPRFTSVVEHVDDGFLLDVLRSSV